MSEEEHASEDKGGALHPSLEERARKGGTGALPTAQSKLVPALTQQQEERKGHVISTSYPPVSSGLNLGTSPPLLPCFPGPGQPVNGKHPRNTSHEVSPWTLSNVSLLEDWEDISTTDPRAG